MTAKGSENSKHNSAVAAPYAGRKLWIVPILVVSLMLGVGAYLKGKFEHAFQESVQANLESILTAQISAVSNWLNVRAAYAKMAASDPQIRTSIVNLESIVRNPNDMPGMLENSPAQAALRQELEPIIQQGFDGFVVIDRKLRIIAADLSRQKKIGNRLTEREAMVIEKLFSGSDGEPHATVSHPFAPETLTAAKDATTSGKQMMLAIALVLGSEPEKTPIAVLCLETDPATVFEGLVRTGRAGRTGETYAYDAYGKLLSPYRFQSPPTTNVITSGRMEPGIDLEGYPDNRGVLVLGAWDWIPNYNFGITTEIEESEAYGPLKLGKGVYWGVFALISLAAASIVPIGWVLDRRDLRAQRAVLEARRLGPYTLGEKIGEGGMGAVYKASHALLQRDTAVKQLHLERTNDATIARFEREVQHASKLNHPNTIAIFDFGRTPEGVFYYAMEYLDGIDLARLVAKHGPQCEGRTVFILKQICASLRKAHDSDLIHRDIKPANIMLNKRGGQYDVVKVLDFGLVKAAGSSPDKSLTVADGFLGTPDYAAPELINHGESVDARSDLYAVGAVAYFLLTGAPVFDGNTALEICWMHVNKPPDPVSKRLGKPVSPGLERVIMSCLEKSPAQRPQSAADLLNELADCTVNSVWTVEDAAAWWAANPVGRSGSSTMPQSGTTHLVETVIDLSHRRL